MKRGFGILFIIIGAINIIIGVMGLGSRFQDEAIAKLMFGFASLALGWWMVNSSNNSKSDGVKIKEKVQTNYKTDDSLQNLSDLKQKGILTDEEYNQKVSKINAEKDEQELKNSVEYKQLKSLLDSNILTKEEFESKVILLKTFSNFKVNQENPIGKVKRYEISVWHKLTNFDKELGKYFTFEISSTLSILDKLECFKLCSSDKYYLKGDSIIFYDTIEELISEKFGINVIVERQ